MELDQFLGKRVRRADVLIYVVAIDMYRILTLIDNFLQAFVLLSQTLDIAIDGAETIFEVIDLVVENFVMSVNSDLAVNERIHTLGDLRIVFGVQFLELLH